MGVLEQAAQRQAKGQAFALATVVRTVSVTAAKAGAKALIAPDGSIEEVWIGGGCARAAVVKAARQCMADGRSRLVSIAPKDALAELGAAAVDALIARIDGAGGSDVLIREPMSLVDRGSAGPPPQQ